MHIVFDPEDAAALEKSFELDESLASQILVIEDDWSIGPLRNFVADGKEFSRSEWLAQLGISLPGTPATEQIKKYLDEDAERSATIWIAPNSRDVCGYYFLVAELQSCKGRVNNIWLNNLPFINEKKQVFYPNFLKEILPSEFVKAKKLALQITAATFETDPDEWHKLIEANDLLRISDGGKKISGKPVDFFDKEIITALQHDWQKAVRLIHHVRSKSNHQPSKIFLLWRIREMIHKQKLEARGEWPSSENFDIRKPQSEPQSETGNE